MRIYIGYMGISGAALREELTINSARPMRETCSFLSALPAVAAKIFKIEFKKQYGKTAAGDVT
jgi:hypothetical protein